MNKGYDAVNYCHAEVLYRDQLQQAQRRANVYGYTELVIWQSADGTLIDEQTIKPNTELQTGARNVWR